MLHCLSRLIIIQLIFNCTNNAALLRGAVNMNTRFFNQQPIDHSHSLFLTDILICMQDFMQPGKQGVTLDTVINMLPDLRLNKLDKAERIALIDTAIKFGSLDLVKIIAEKYITHGFADDIRLPYEGHGEHPYRPVFWLAAICTRLPNIPVENYDKIEMYLCQKFNIPSSVNIAGTNVTRNEYVQIINEWKEAKNLELSARGRGEDRYQIL